MTVKRVCSVPGCPAVQVQARCLEHRREEERRQRRTVPTKRTRTRGEQERRARTVAEHVAKVGYWCPGYEKRAPHMSTDLTADHVTAIDNGGNPNGPLIVRCRSCNSARGNRFK